jgi:CRISPR-associated endonuclease/helicase Cas3
LKLGPGGKDLPDRRELCPVPFHRFKKSFPALLNSGRIWRRNYRQGWQIINKNDEGEIYPGQIYLLEKSCGGYTRDRGWTGNSAHSDFDIPEPTKPSPETLQDDQDDAEDLSQINMWLAVLDHTRDVSQKLEQILRESDVSEGDVMILRLAARWHDRGKAHQCFQSKLIAEKIESEIVQGKLLGEPAAKAPNDAWRKNGLRVGFRHELASALAILETLRSHQPEHQAFAWPEGLDRAKFGVPTDETPGTKEDDRLAQELTELTADQLDLLVYLVASHHGKVRISIRSSPDDDPPEGKRQARGVQDGDVLPGCRIPSADLRSGVPAPQVVLSMDPMELGLSSRYGASWRERMQLLLERIGPFRLSYLEALLRAADCRASIEENLQGRT